MASLKEPREDAISDTIGITGLQREDAVRWLKAYDNDANKAIDAFFENPNAIHDQQSQVEFDANQAQRWNEDHFHMDNSDNSHHDHNKLGVPRTDALTPGVFGDSVPSRPPSRMSALTFTEANGANQTLSGESEDAQVKRAMAMSMGDSQTLPDQENGILEHENFRPATRDHYDTEKWAMTVIEPQTQEIILNPEPFDRKRPWDAPAFFKPSPAGHRLPALLTILHAIPAAREALLNRTVMLPDYGLEKDWWDGTAIKLLQIVNQDAEDQTVPSNSIIPECQRLMAFLDKTERAYGSIDALAGIMGDLHTDEASELYRRWHDATVYYAPDDPWVNLFTSKGIKLSEENPQSRSFHCLIARIDDEISGRGLTLYEALDHILWSDNKDDEETFLEDPGDVFTIEVANLVASEVGLGIEIPEIWYADRYLASATKEVKNMLSSKGKVNAEWDAQVKRQGDMTQYSNSLNGSKLDAMHLLSKAVTYFEETKEYSHATSSLSISCADSKDAAGASISCTEMVQELKLLNANISSKLKALEDVQKRLGQQMKEISRLYTEPSDDLGQPPHRRYSLRGVSTNPNTVYVLERTPPEADDWQWWKLEFVRNDAKPVIYERMTVDAVLQAASTESTNALLVYASEAAVSYQPRELSPQLNNFVRADNLNFSRELDGSTLPQPALPTKRNAHINDDSNCLEGSQQRSSSDDDNLNSTVTSKETLDGKSSSYRPGQLSPHKLSDQRTDFHQTRSTGSFDEVIPGSLGRKGSSFDSKESLVDPDSMSNGCEMRERGRSSSLLRHSTANAEQYTLGSYMPEVIMEDDEAERDHKKGLGTGL